MSVTMMDEKVEFSVTVKAVPCKGGGCEGAVEEIPVVAQADSMEDLHAAVSDGVNVLIRRALTAVKFKSENR